MYNLFAYINKQQENEQQQKKIKSQTDFLLRHEQFKKQAHEKLKERADEFLVNQVTAENPFRFEDDHYQRWRQHRVYRDVEDAKKFVGFKTFRHRPNEDMDKFYTPRERKQIQYLASKKQDLVNSGKLLGEQISRSQRSQGPYNPKIEFRVTKQDQEYLQPRLRFTNITDKQKMSESAMNFDERVKKIYSKFEMSKSKLGKAVRSSMSRYYDESSSGIHLGEFQKKKSLSLMRKSSKQLDQPEAKDLSIMDSTKMSQYIEQRNHARRKSKTYFKLTKTMQMFHPDQERRLQFDTLLKKSQYDRSLDLKNIVNNTFYENYQKAPIL